MRLKLSILCLMTCLITPSFARVPMQPSHPASEKNLFNQKYQELIQERNKTLCDHGLETILAYKKATSNLVLSENTDKIKSFINGKLSEIEHNLNNLKLKSHENNSRYEKLLFDSAVIKINQLGDFLSALSSGKDFCEIGKKSGLVSFPSEVCKEEEEGSQLDESFILSDNFSIKSSNKDNDDEIQKKFQLKLKSKDSSFQNQFLRQNTTPLQRNGQKISYLEGNYKIS